MKNNFFIYLLSHFLLDPDPLLTTATGTTATATATATTVQLLQPNGLAMGDTMQKRDIQYLAIEGDIHYTIIHSRREQ